MLRGSIAPIRTVSSRFTLPLALLVASLTAHASDPVSTSATTPAEQVATADDNQQLKQQFSTVAKQCEQSLTQCLIDVEPLLARTKPGSLYWRELMLLKLDSLFFLQRGADVLRITTELLQNKNWPPNFLARLYIYHAKELHAVGRKLESQHYIDKVSALLNSFHAADRLPLTELRLVNVRMYIDGDRQAAYDQLKSMIIRYDGSGDWDLRFSLYHNLAHVCEFLHKFDEATLHRAKAQQLADEGPNTHYKALTRYYRVSLALQLGDFNDNNYLLLQQAEHFASSIGADFLRIRCHLLQAELAHRQGHRRKALALFADISPAELTDETRDDYQRMQQLLHPSR